MARNKIYIVLMLAALSAFAAILLSGQAPDPEKKNPDFTTEVNMVTVPISARRPEGGFIKGIPQGAFHIYEDGVPQNITYFEQEGLPTHIAIVLDISGSVLREWGAIKHATTKFIENLKPDDQFSLTTFNTEIRLKMDWTLKADPKADRVEAVLGSIYCKDNTKLWDAVWVVSNDVFKDIAEKKAMIIMSDGLDNQSSVSYDEALQAAVRSKAAVYVVSKTEAIRQLTEYEYNRIPQKEFANADLALRKLAMETGGRVLYPNSFGQLGNVYAEVDEELRNQYTLGYNSTNTAKDGSYRHIRVRVDTQDKADISARLGYYAPGELLPSPAPRNK
jgi:Ca-activated chloride channel homolog